MAIKLLNLQTYTLIGFSDLIRSSTKSNEKETNNQRESQNKRLMLWIGWNLILQSQTAHQNAEIRLHLKSLHREAESERQTDRQT